MENSKASKDNIDPKSKDKTYSKNALYIVCNRGNLEGAKILLENGTHRRYRHSIPFYSTNIQLKKHLTKRLIYYLGPG